MSSQESGPPLHLGPSRFAAHRTPVSSHESDAHFVLDTSAIADDDKAVDFCEFRHTVRATTRRVLQNFLSCFPSTCSCVSRNPWRNSLPSDLKELQNHEAKVVFAQDRQTAQWEAIDKVVSLSRSPWKHRTGDHSLHPMAERPVHWAHLLWRSSKTGYLSWLFSPAIICAHSLRTRRKRCTR